ncbi:MAG: hypothetical protein H6825_04615 [Planctomycetes bacterium]|nr:hypothetical protein [Planctomycetota bacterium]
MSRRAEARARLLARARHELPEPGDPTRLMADLQGSGVDADELLEVVGRVVLAHRQLRDMNLERSWQRGYGWFLARNVMVFGLIMLALRLGLGLNQIAMDGALAGVALYYVVVLVLMPLRVRGHVRRRKGILANYQRDLGEYLERLERGAPREASGDADAVDEAPGSR